MSVNGRAGQPVGGSLAAVELAIVALEGQRPALGDDVVDTALAPLRERRHTLLSQDVTEARKLVTVLFADLVGFTAISGQLDAEDIREVVQACFSSWHHAIETNGGGVEKFIGDAVMAVFGLHQSWEDDAERALRAALAMTSALSRLNEDVGRRLGVELHMRVGLDSGEVVISTLGKRPGHEFVAVGPTVNRASRLQSVAPTDRVLISADTHRLVRGAFSVEPLAGLVLKGIDKPVDGFVVVSERPRGFRMDRAAAVAGLDTRTVGRDLELTFLQERLWDVVDDGQWRVVTIVGDAGLGKSRLLLEFDAWLGARPEPIWWFRGRASHSGQNRANALLRDVIATRMEIQESDAPATIRDKLQKGFGGALADGNDLLEGADVAGAWLGFDLGDEATAVPADPQSLRDSGSAVLAEYFASLARRAPVIILLEDLHWADDGSLRWLDAADTTLSNVPVLVVATTRPSLIEERPRWAEGLGHHVRLNLNPLSRREARNLVRQLLQRVHEPPTALVDLIVQAADGNPFYVEELVTWFIDTGVIVPGEPHWHVATQLLGSLIVPSTLKGVLQARLDALEAVERQLLQRASVVGRVFWDDAVAHLESEATPDAYRALDELRRRDIVLERELSVFASSREFIFKHALLRDVAYDSVLRAHRRRYHRRTATWLIGVSSRNGREDEFAALIGEHLDRADDPEAPRWYLRAGTQGARVFALDEATRLLGRADEVVPHEDVALRFDILAAREEVLERRGDRAGQARDLETMAHLVGQLDDSKRPLTLLLAQSRQLFEQSDYPAAVATAERAIHDAAEAGLAMEEAEGHLWRGKAMTWGNDHDAARKSLATALELGRDVQRPALVGESLRYLSMVANNAGDYSVALEKVGEARQVFAESGDIEAESMAMAQYATTCFNMGRIDEAGVVFEQVLPIFQRSRHIYRQSVVLGNLASIACIQCRLAQSLRLAGEAIDIARQLEDREATAVNLTVKGVAELMTSQWQVAAEDLTEALGLGRTVSSATIETDALSRLGVAALEKGDLSAALTWAREATCAAVDVSPLQAGHAHLVLAYALLEDNAHEDASRSFADARDMFVTIDVAALVRESDAGLARVDLAVGLPDVALRRIGPLLDHLGPADLQSCLRPAAVLHACWSVLRAAADPRAEGLLLLAREYLTERASRVGDADLAAGYLALPLHAELLGPAHESH